MSHGYASIWRAVHFWRLFIFLGPRVLVAAARRTAGRRPESFERRQAFFIFW